MAITPNINCATFTVTNFFRRGELNSISTAFIRINYWNSTMISQTISPAGMSPWSKSFRSVGYVFLRLTAYVCFALQATSGGYAPLRLTPARVRVASGGE